jgi:hypothetical protein
MKTKVVLVGLSLLMFIFCSASISQAAKLPIHNTPSLPPANEHPWQDSGSPPVDGDPILPDLLHPTFIMIRPVSVMIFWPAKAEPMPKGNQWVGNEPNGNASR